MDNTSFPPNLTIDRAKILELFTGETFYSSIDAAIREAILNAIDAVSRRRETNSSISQEIDVRFDRQSLTITVSDNGDGMSEKQITELFAKVGASAATITANAVQGQYNAVGEFGIGVLSYFLVCERFQIHSKTEQGESLGLEFTRTMLDGETTANIVDSQRTTQGTDLILFINRDASFNEMLEQFPHWIRDVEGLTATEFPGDHSIDQGGIGRQVKRVDMETPEWIHRAHIGPPELLNVWEEFDGSAHVDILYRGVFVSRLVVDKLWAIEGTIHVDPKHFRPKLNREGFVGDLLQSELEPVLRSFHPLVLERAIECVREVLDDKVTQYWPLRRWITLWLAVPRNGPYQQAASLWDEEFRERKAFRMLGPSQKHEDVSVGDLERLVCEDLHIAPLDLSRQNHVVQQAVRILRNSGQFVIQGIDKEPQYLESTDFVGASSGDLLYQFFRKSLTKKLIRVEDIAQVVISREAVATMFDGTPTVKLVRLGADSAAVIPVSDEIWINIEHDDGKAIVRSVCSRNEGYIALWVGCMDNGKEYAGKIAKLLAKRDGSGEKLGPIKRQYLMRVID